MYKFMFSVLVSLMFISTRNLALSAELCDQEIGWRNEVCLHIYNTVWINNLLFCTVRESDNVLELNFDLREPENVTSLEDFQLEIRTYRDILNNLDRQLEAYKASPASGQQAQIRGFSPNVTTYQTSLRDLKVQVGHILQHLAMTVNGNGELAAPTTSPTLVQGTLVRIFTETYHTSTRLYRLLQQWVCNCSSCLPARDPFSRCDISPAISNDVCM